MKYFAVLLASLMSVSTSVQPSEEELASLDSLKWKYRVLVIFAETSLVDAALANLNALATGIEERDMVWFLFANDELHSNYSGNLGIEFREQIMDRYFTPAPAETMVVLIGKDGGVKSSKSDLDLEATFGLIDQMPMRKAELRRAADKLD